MIESIRRSNPLLKRRFTKRQGGVLVLVAIFLVVLIGMAAFSIDLAYIELVKTQLKAATDAAAKAGTSALVQGLSDADAQAAAINIAAANTVAGKPLKITVSDITIGQSVQQADGTWQFVAGLKPSQAVQVTSVLSSSNANGSVPLFFAPLLGTSSYSTSLTSVASSYACEVCLVVDRSHSMTYDLSGVNQQFPLPIGSDWIAGMKSPPITGSRWLALESAMSSFCGILQVASAPPRVALVTWASDIGTSSIEYSLTGQTSVGVSLDLGLTNDTAALYSAIHNRSNNVMLGATNMGAGIDEGITVLTASNVRPYAKRVMVLMTDGLWNRGNDPVNSATVAAGQDITIHCICFLKNADQTTCQEIASITGGKFYYASDAASLTAAFNDLAYSLPVVLTK